VNDAARAAPHLPLVCYLAVAGLLVVFVALTTSFDVLLMGAALRAAATRSAGRACAARLFAATLVRALFGALIAAAAFLVRVHFDSFVK
jgi:putative Mn2+ efflux pump MntP